MSQFGFWSEKQKEHGVYEYELLDGTPVWVTCVTESPNHESYTPDAVLLGELKPDSWKRTLGKISARFFKQEISGFQPKLKPGDICPKCKKEFKQRELLTSTFIGCMC